MKPKTGRPKGKPAVVRAAKAKRTKSALELRIAGLSIDQIARRLGVSLSTASTDLSAALQAQAAETKDRADELRALELGRLDELVLALWPRRQAAQTAEKIAKVIAQRCKLLGLDAPTRIEHGGTLQFEAARAALAEAIARVAEDAPEGEAPEDSGGPPAGDRGAAEP